MGYKRNVRDKALTGPERLTQEEVVPAGLCNVDFGFDSGCSLLYSRDAQPQVRVSPWGQKSGGGEHGQLTCPQILSPLWED